MTPTVLRGASVPLDPTTDEARNWLVQELSDPAYVDDRGVLERVVAWILEHLGRIPAPAGAPSWTLPVVVTILLGVGVLVLVRRVRHEPSISGRTRAGSGEVLDDPGLSADDYRARAAAALAAGDHAGAAADWFRALVAACRDRTLLDDGPGRTAHEIAATLAGVFPAEASALAAAADLFDRVVYGHDRVERADAQGMADLDERLVSARPHLDAAAVSR